MDAPHWTKCMYYVFMFACACDTKMDYVYKHNQTMMYKYANFHDTNASHILITCADAARRCGWKLNS